MTATFKKFVLLFFILIISCKPASEEKLVNTPTLETIDNYFSPVFNESFFQNAHFGYTDTTHYPYQRAFYTTETILQQNSTFSFLRNCKATMNNDSLQLTLNDDTFSRCDYEIEILKANKRFTSNIKYTLAFLDSSYVPPVYDIIKHNILLDKKEYNKGDILKGKIAFQALLHPVSSEKNSDTIFIYGLIKTMVE